MRVKDFLLDRDWFKLVDALEEMTDYWNFGRNIVDAPTYNAYLPTRQHIMEKPNVLDDRTDGMPYKYGLMKMGPT
jgi:hypothetical protein